MAKQSIILIGGGDHALCVTELLRKTSAYEFVGYTDVKKSQLDLTYLGNDQDFLSQKLKTFKNTLFAMGIGSDIKLRALLFEKYQSIGCRFITFIHPSAQISQTAQIEEGSLIFPGVAVGPFVKLAKNVLLHDQTVVEHHSEIGAHSYLSPQTVIAGRCRLGQQTFCGIHTSVIENIQIAGQTCLGAGAVVVKDITEKGLTWVGVPAKALVKQNV
ncbi:MAG: hypothetical protein COV74_09680 [Candidatus Omnitrophica bacterium CG11_big_fil_rev_8_21_14_0_20_45_26]|uniref:PglD N-terminal domain-containing protein n=1 Tax=Candidatus Abzuiibacterium crystallinum TaxID=1974748 RepID=A0A2H0LLF4_9BACT|nr:MAG: hypothetical protein COV74_09680 [Candidatus Omnitrophica bacterium CG11_big_fil_rev_8_21_14_0_20_45_26]PIW64478.1 MAG: hypothetical protein COW12_05805 [Candidatus Omnitrophica bacterium CG12_big_fil_rev_8_21_14_0_65_45_16]